MRKALAFVVLALLAMTVSVPAFALWVGQTGNVLIDISPGACMLIGPGSYDLQGGECDITAHLWGCVPTPSGCSCSAHVTATTGDCGDVPLGQPTIWSAIRAN